MNLRQPVPYLPNNISVDVCIHVMSVNGGNGFLSDIPRKFHSL